MENGGRGIKEEEKQPNLAPPPMHDIMRSKTCPLMPPTQSSLYPIEEEKKDNGEDGFDSDSGPDPEASLYQPSVRQSRLNRFFLNTSTRSEKQKLLKHKSHTIEKQLRREHQITGVQKRYVDRIYCHYIKEQTRFILWLCIAIGRLDELTVEENTLIKDLGSFMDRLVYEYVNELTKGENKNSEHIEYLQEIVRRGTIMVNKIKEPGASTEDMMLKIKEFVDAVQTNRRQCSAKLGRIIEILVFVALGAAIGGFLGYTVGHLFFLYFAQTMISAGFSTGASLGLALGQSGIGVGAVVAANLSVFTRFSIFYKETPLEKLGNNVGVAATQVVTKRPGA